MKHHYNGMLPRIDRIYWTSDKRTSLPHHALIMTFGFSDPTLIFEGRLLPTLKEPKGA